MTQSLRLSEQYVGSSRERHRRFSFSRLTLRQPCLESAALTSSATRGVDRYYDPSTDQFLSVDPDVAETGQPYAFTGDDPLNEKDPTGLLGTCGGQAGDCVQSGGHAYISNPQPAPSGSSGQSTSGAAPSSSPGIGDVAAALYAADSLNHGDAVRVGYDITAFDYETSVYFTRLLNFVNANSPSGGTAVKVEDDLITVACGQLAIAQGEQGLSTSQGLSMGFDCYGTLNTLADSSSGRRLVREAADQFSCIDVISGDGLSPAQPSLDSGDSECNASDAYSHNGYP